MTARTATLKPARAPAKEAKAADVSDEALLEAYRSGQTSAFRTLVERHERPVYRFCLRALGDPEAAADATQEVFLRVIKHAPSWERKAKFTTWLYTIARNYCIDEARKGRFRKTESLNAPLCPGDGEEGGERIDRVEDKAPLSDRLADGKRIREVVDRVLAELPPEQREVFCLREYAGLAFQDIADAVGAGENTVKSRMRYALLALRKGLLAAGFSPPRKAPPDSS